MIQQIKKYFQTIFRSFLQKINISEENSVIEEKVELYSVTLERQVSLRMFLPPAYSRSRRKTYPLVLFNDGQDMDALGMLACLNALFQNQKQTKFIIVGIEAGDRMQEYGTVQPKDYLDRGSKAPAYTQFVIEELLPHLHQNYACQKGPKAHTLAGFSLGGLSAIDIVWNYPNLFGQVGVFSGSLWWRSRAFDPNTPDADRIMHAIVQQGPKRKNMRFWLQAGTHDETSDRNNNGVIDAIDDTLDLIKALEKLGYQQGKDIHYLEVEGGEHNPQTWGEVMPDFLKWI